jgi:hypothetical protein
MENGYGEQVLEICMLVDTMFYHLLKQDVHHILLKSEIKNVWLQPYSSFDINIERISFGSIIATQNHINSTPIFMAVSSIIYSSIFFFYLFFCKINVLIHIFHIFLLFPFCKYHQTLALLSQ